MRHEVTLFHVRALRAGLGSHHLLISVHFLALRAVPCGGVAVGAPFKDGAGVDFEVGLEAVHAVSLEGVAVYCDAFNTVARVEGKGAFSLVVELLQGVHSVTDEVG